MNTFVSKLYFGAKAAVYNFFHEEDGDVNIVSIVILIGIAVILALIFRKEIAKLITDLLSKISGSATDAIDKNKAP